MYADDNGSYLVNNYRGKPQTIATRGTYVGEQC